VGEHQADHFISDCPMAATHIENLAESLSADEKPGQHPMTLLRKAYGI